MNTELLLSQAHALYRTITETLIHQEQTITTMESCTCGLIASLISDTEGSSAVLKGAFVTYSNTAKTARGVPEEVIEQYGVYSKETALCMAEAARKAYPSDYAIGITGSFSNVDPNNSDSVPGMVFCAVISDTEADVFSFELPLLPDRFSCKLSAAITVGEHLLALLAKTQND